VCASLLQNEKEERLRKKVVKGGTILPTLLFFDESARIDGLGLPAPLARQGAGTSSLAAPRASTGVALRGSRGEGSKIADRRRASTLTGVVGSTQEAKGGNADGALGGSFVCEGSQLKVELVGVDVMGASTKGVTRKGCNSNHAYMPRAQSCPMIDSPTRCGPPFKSMLAVGDTSQSRVEKCRLQIRDGNVGGGGEQNKASLPLATKMLPRSQEGGFG